jgi:integrase/recombinase XerD
MNKKQQLLELLKEQELPTSEIAKEIEIAKTTLYQYITQLHNQNKIKRRKDHSRGHSQYIYKTNEDYTRKELKLLEKTYFTYDISDYDYNLFKGFLEEKFKISKNTYESHKYNVIECLNYIKKPIEEIDIVDIAKYLTNVINKKDIQITTKNAYRYNISSFFQYVQQQFLTKREEAYHNPVPSKDVFKFTKSNKIKRKPEKEEKFTKKELLTILDNSKKREFRDFIIFAILIATGMRIGECLSIRVNQIDLERRLLDTGFDKGARKSTKTSGESIRFFLPKGLIRYLKKYLYMIKGDKWLVSGREKYLTPSGFRSTSKERYPKKFSKFHKYRKTLITNRVKKMECPLWISEGLMNHVPSSVEGRAYIKLSIPEKRELYDKYFPYKAFPYF